MPKKKYTPDVNSAEIQLLNDLDTVFWLLGMKSENVPSRVETKNTEGVLYCKIFPESQDAKNKQFKEDFIKNPAKIIQLLKEETDNFEGKFKKDLLSPKIRYCEKVVLHNQIGALRSLDLVSDGIATLKPIDDFKKYKTSLVKDITTTFKKAQTLISLKTEIQDHLNEKIGRIDAKVSNYRASCGKREQDFNKKFPVIHANGIIKETPAELFRAQLLTPQKDRVLKQYEQEKESLAEKIKELPSKDDVASLNKQLFELKSSPNKKVNDKEASNFYDAAEKDIKALLTFIDKNADKADRDVKILVFELKQLQSVLKWSKENVNYTSDLKKSIADIVQTKIDFKSDKTGLMVRDEDQAEKFLTNFRKNSIFKDGKVIQSVSNVEKENSGDGLELIDQYNDQCQFIGKAIEVNDFLISLEKQGELFRFKENGEYVYLKEQNGRGVKVEAPLSKIPELSAPGGNSFLSEQNRVSINSNCSINGIGNYNNSPTR